MSRRHNPALNYRPTEADEWSQTRLPGTPPAELGGRRLIPAMEIARPYTQENAPLFAPLAGLKVGLEAAREAFGEDGLAAYHRAIAEADEAQSLEPMQDTGYLAGEYGEAGELIEEER